jgi:hypothetical protein
MNNEFELVYRTDNQTHDSEDCYLARKDSPGTGTGEIFLGRTLPGSAGDIRRVLEVFPADFDDRIAERN